VNLFDILARQRRFVYLSVALLSAAGVWAALHLPSAIYPELAFPRVVIIVQGSSLGARQQVFGVTRPIEEAVSVVPGVERVRSLSIRGSSEISIWFSPRADMTAGLQLIQARVNQVRSQLPPDLEMEIERLTPSVFPILSYNLSGGDAAALYDIARYQVKPVLSRIRGVGRVDIQGSDTREIEVVADPGRLAAHGLSYADLAAAIRESITPEAVGRMGRDYKQYLLVTDVEARGPEDVAAVVVRPGLRVRDVATVVAATEDHVRMISGDGRPVAIVNVTRQPGGNTLQIADSVAAAVASLRAQLPPGVRLKSIYDQAGLVRDAVRSVRDAMLVGAVLATIVLLLFLRRGRITAISAASIPLTLTITVFVMRLLGQTFNLMTLGAMAIAIGLVVDDAVVVTENIARHLHLHEGRSAAVRHALQELIWPVTTSTITTVVVFLPLGLLQGVVGQFFIALSVTLASAVIVSWFLALSIIPLLAEQYVTADEPPAGLGGGAAGSTAAAPLGRLARLGHALDRLPDWYERSLGAVIHHPKRLLAGALALVALGISGQRMVGSGFLPEMDEGAFVFDYWTPGGTALAETDRQLRVVERIMAGVPEITGTARRTGAEMGLFATQQNTGDIVAKLRPHGRRSRDIFAVMDDVRDQVSAALPRLRFEFIQILSDVINDLAGATRPVEIKLFGDHLDSLENYARGLAVELAKVEGLEDLYDGVSEPSPEMLLRIDAAEARRADLSPEQVGEAVNGALLGVPAGEVRGDDRTIGVRVRAPDAVRFDAERLGALPIIAGPGRRVIPLSALVSVRAVEARAEHLRENQRQLIVMEADVSGRSLGTVMKDVQRVLAAHPAPAGIRVELGGQYAGQQEAFRALLLVLALAVLSVVGVMVVQFESFVEPLTIVLVAPVSFVGAIALLLVTGTPLNVSSLMGLILLVGLIVKNGIILLDFTRRRMRLDGLPLEAAIRDAARVRLRPILMTTLCTLFGLLPLALGLGAGAELQRPLALAVIGGLALSTPITLFVVPTLLVAIRGRDYLLERTEG
jgi:CzcA family heavy metal efflux pump